MKEHFNLFNTTDQVIVHNPTKTDFRFMVGGEREYEVKAGQMKLLHGSAARLYVKKMCDAWHIQNNQIANLHNADAEIELATTFVKSVIGDDQELDEKTLASLLKSAKASDVPEVQEEDKEPTKEAKQTENKKQAAASDSAPAKPAVEVPEEPTTEAEFPEVTKKSAPKPAKK